MKNTLKIKNESDFDMLELIKELPSRRPYVKSYLEIIGVSHRETIMANVLGYYFDPNEKHKLGDTFIKALLNTEPTELLTNTSCKFHKDVLALKDSDFNDSEIIIEDSTDDNKRIDLIINTPKLVIGIEFKINHELNNPLCEYVEYIKQTYNKKEYCFIVLSPKWKEPGSIARENKEFKQVMLSHFIKNVVDFKNKLQLESESEKLMTYEEEVNFSDFIKTIENRKIKTDMIDAFKSAVRDNKIKQSEIEKTFQNLLTIKTDIEEKVKEYQKSLNDTKNIQTHLLPNSKHKLEAVLIHKIDKNSQLKIRLNLKGWHLEYWKKNSDLKPKKIHFEQKPPSLIELKAFIDDLDFFHADS